MIAEGGHQLGNYLSAITARHFQYRNKPADFTEKATLDRNTPAVKTAKPFQLDGSSKVSCLKAFVVLQKSDQCCVGALYDRQK